VQRHLAARNPRFHDVSRLESRVASKRGAGLSSLEAETSVMAILETHSHMLRGLGAQKVHRNAASHKLCCIDNLRIVHDSGPPPPPPRALTGSSRRSRHAPHSPASSPRCTCAGGRAGGCEARIGSLAIRVLRPPRGRGTSPPRGRGSTAVTVVLLHRAVTLLALRSQSCCGIVVTVLRPGTQSTL
jgi:hypothetical protein